LANHLVDWTPIQAVKCIVTSIKRKQMSFVAGCINAGSAELSAQILGEADGSQRVRSEAMVDSMGQLQAVLQPAPSRMLLRQCNAVPVSDCLHVLELWSFLRSWMAHTLNHSNSLEICRILSFIPCYINAMMDAFDMSGLLNRIALHHARASSRLHTFSMPLSRHGL
jgi:hypothetical protein